MKKLLSLILFTATLYGAVDEIETRLKEQCKTNDTACLELAKHYYDKTDMANALKVSQTLCKKDNSYGCEVAFFSAQELRHSNRYDYVIKGCDKLKSGYSCRIIASRYIDLGDDNNALKYFKRGCKYGDNESCLAYKNRTGQDIRESLK